MSGLLGRGQYKKAQSNLLRQQAGKRADMIAAEVARDEAMRNAANKEAAGTVIGAASPFAYQFAKDNNIMGMGKGPNAKMLNSADYAKMKASVDAMPNDKLGNETRALFAKDYHEMTNADKFGQWVDKNINSATETLTGTQAPAPVSMHSPAAPTQSMQNPSAAIDALGARPELGPMQQQYVKTLSDSQIKEVPGLEGLYKSAGKNNGTIYQGEGIDPNTTAGNWGDAGGFSQGEGLTHGEMMAQPTKDGLLGVGKPGTRMLSPDQYESGVSFSDLPPKPPEVVAQESMRSVQGQPAPDTMGLAEGVRPDSFAENEAARLGNEAIANKVTEGGVDKALTVATGKMGEEVGLGAAKELGGEAGKSAVTSFTNSAATETTKEVGTTVVNEATAKITGEAAKSVTNSAAQNLAATAAANGTKAVAQSATSSAASSVSSLGAGIAGGMAGGAIGNEIAGPTGGKVGSALGSAIAAGAMTGPWGAVIALAIAGIMELF